MNGTRTLNLENGCWNKTICLGLGCCWLFHEIFGTNKLGLTKVSTQSEIDSVHQVRHWVFFWDVKHIILLMDKILHHQG